MTTTTIAVPRDVPDGYMPIPTAEQLADALENVRCFHDLGAELIAPELLANLLAVTTVKESLSVAPSLPAAGSAEEEVEVVAWRYRHSEQEKWQAGVERKSLWETEPLMTVAQHERIVAVLRAQIAERDAAIEEWSGTAVQNGMEVDRLSAALSAQQSAPDRVSVLCEALEDARRAMFAVLNQEPRMKAVAKRVLNAEIERIDRALLASQGRGEA